MTATASRSRHEHGDRPVRPGEPVERGELAVVPEPRQREVHGVELGPDDRPGARPRPQAERRRGSRTWSRSADPSARPSKVSTRSSVSVAVGHGAVSRRTRRSWTSTAARPSPPDDDRCHRAVHRDLGQRDPCRERSRRPLDLRDERREAVEAGLVRGHVAADRVVLGREPAGIGVRPGRAIARGRRSRPGPRRPGRPTAGVAPRPARRSTPGAPRSPRASRHTRPRTRRGACRRGPGS